MSMGIRLLIIIPRIISSFVWMVGLFFIYLHLEKFLFIFILYLYFISKSFAFKIKKE